MKNKWIIISIIAGVVLIGGIITGVLLMNKKKPVPDPVPAPPKIEKVIITFDADGGEKVDNLEIDKGAQVLLPSTTKEGYTFAGWYLNDTEIKSTYVYNESITVKAKWEKIKEEEKTFKVTFDSKGGSKVNAMTIVCGKTLTLPKNPTKSGYKFISWVDKNEKPILNGAKLSCENVTLYAKWEEVKKEEPKTEPAPTPEPTPEPQKTYTCPSGYTLSGTKCTIEGSSHETCPSDTKVDGSLCIRTSDNNAGTRQCKEDTVAIDGKGHTWTGRGDYYMAGFGHCAYYKWTNITNQNDCTTNINRKAVWVSVM